MIGLLKKPLWIFQSHSKRFSGNLLSKDLSLCNDCPVKKAIVVLSIWLKGNSKHFFDNSLSPLGAQS